MALKIFSPGLDQYGPGGSARVKVLVIGGPGSGKTRWSSFFPQPIYADAEAGLSSIADRGKAVAAVSISNSQDMLDLLKLLEMECRKPALERRWNTIVVDTIDAFQRKVQDEWLRKNPNAERFSGFDAWGYLDAKMQLLLTRLLNLDMNVVVTVHYDEKTVTEGSGDTATQRQVIQLQLQGKSKDQLFNDFDLVGWMGTYYEQEKGQRVLKRGLTFQPTYEKPFLKDRLHVTPSWMPVEFSTDDYDALFAAIAEKLDKLPDSEELGEVPATEPDQGIAEGGLVLGGALPEVSEKDIPLEQHDKPTLQGMCRKFDPPIDFKGNNTKAELIAWIRERKAREADGTAPQQTAPPAAPAPEPVKTDDTSAAPAAEEVKAQATPTVEQLAAQAADTAAPAQPIPAPAPEPAPAPQAAAPVEQQNVVDTEAGPVDTATGEVLSDTHQQAVDTAKQQLGGTVIDDRQDVASARSTVESSSTATVPAATASAPQGGQRGPAPAVGGQCEQDGCEVELAGETPDLVKLSYIKFRKRLCNAHFQQAREKAAN